MVKRVATTAGYVVATIAAALSTLVLVTHMDGFGYNALGWTIRIIYIFVVALTFINAYKFKTCGITKTRYTDKWYKLTSNNIWLHYFMTLGVVAFFNATTSTEQGADASGAAISALTPIVAGFALFVTFQIVSALDGNIHSDRSDNQRSTERPESRDL